MGNDSRQEFLVEPIDISQYWKIVLILIYSSVGVASLVGNLIVVLVVVVKKNMRTVTNIFISSVSVADLVITGCSLWASPLSYYRQQWLLGKAMCYIVTSVQGASLIWVPFTLAAIAIDRYLLVASPFRRQMSVKTCVFTIISIWIGAFAVLTPMLVNLDYYEFRSHSFCVENWRPNHDYRLAYGISVLIIRSGLPLAVIAWCHWQIATILNAQENKFQRTKIINHNDISRKQRLQNLLKAMVIIFAVSSFPLDMFNVLQDLEMTLKGHDVGIQLVPDHLRQFIFFLSHWTAMAGTLLNPLIYAWYNDNFRKQIKGCLAEVKENRKLTRGAYSSVLSGQNSHRLPHSVRSVLIDTPRENSVRHPVLVEECEDDVQV